MTRSNAALRLAEPVPAPARRRRDPTLRVGLLILLGIAAGVAVLTTMTDAALFRGRYVVTTRVPDAAGIRAGDPVRLRGVNVGRVLGFGLEPDGVAIRLELEGEYEVPADSRVHLRSGGLLGGTVAEIVPGRSPEALGYGDVLPGAAGPTLQDATSRVFDGADDLMNRAGVLLSDGLIDDAHASASDLRAVLGAFSTAVDQERAELLALTASLRRSAEGLERSATGPELERTLARLDRTAAGAEELVASLDRSARSLDVVLGRLERGEGTLGRLSTDDALYEELSEAARTVNRVGDAVEALMADVQSDPRRYFKFSVF